MKKAIKEVPMAKYKEMHRLMPIVCVDLVIVRGKKFLLVKRKNEPEKGQWFFPGGRVLKDERFEAAALRKLREETGLRGRVKKFLGASEHFYVRGYFKGFSSHVVTVVFLVAVLPQKQEAVRLDAQSSDASWCATIDTTLHPYVKKFLRNAGFPYGTNHLQHPPIRTSDHRLYPAGT